MDSRGIVGDYIAEKTKMVRFGGSFSAISAQLRKFWGENFGM